jgi:uncharacterized protein
MTDCASVDEVIGFDCAQARLWGIVSRPAKPNPSAPAVLIVVGGPQYRAGSHRMFVSLARALSTAGFPALRFDATGMGDSEGELRRFDGIAADLGAALDALTAAFPRSQGIVVWGLCDAASAALMFAADDPRVIGVVAANPWARDDATFAAVRVKHYYLSRLVHRDFWRKALRGGLSWGDSLRSFAADLRGARSRGGRVADAAGGIDFRTAMARGLQRLPGRLLLIVSGNDLTAKEFLAHAATATAWRGLLQDRKVSRVDLADADHTFSRRCWLDTVEAETIAWLNQLARPRGNAAVSARHGEAP